ncbi:MAG: hypothetical protein HYZ20_13955 [Burkholderiales bacterium]|nr:hypothetical protein [Burkholderiales bacterium]
MNATLARTSTGPTPRGRGAGPVVPGVAAASESTPAKPAKAREVGAWAKRCGARRGPRHGRKAPKSDTTCRQYVFDVHCRALTIFETATFVAEAARIWSDDERLAFCAWIATEPEAGAVVKGGDVPKPVERGRMTVPHS